MTGFSSISRPLCDRLFAHPMKENAVFDLRPGDGLVMDGAVSGMGP
jgi:hypothetical protein